MQARIQKWDNDLGLCIPPAMAVAAGIEIGSIVEIAVVEGRIVIIPVGKRPATLSELVSGITDENLHEEWDTGPPQGNEEW